MKVLSNLGTASNKTISVKTADNRIDYIIGKHVTSAGFVREKVDRCWRWVFVLNYQSPFYTKISDLQEALYVIEELFGQEAREEAEQTVRKHTKKQVGGE